MIRMKYNILIILIMICILSSTANAYSLDKNMKCYLLENDMFTTENTININFIQKQLIEMCQLELGISLEDVIQEHELIKSEKQFDNKDLIHYDMVYKGMNISNIVFQENIQLEFYKNKLEHVLFRFKGNGEILKAFFINKWGIPTSSIVLFSKENYIWQNNDYQVDLIIKDDTGSLVFYYMPYIEKVNKIKHLEYVEYLKMSPEVINRLENLIKNNEQFKISFKRELQNDPNYAEALQEAGMNMNIFN